MMPTTTAGTPPHKGSRGKHRHSKSVAGHTDQTDSLLPSFPQNPHHLRQNLNGSRHHVVQSSVFGVGVTDPSDNGYQTADVPSGPTTPPQTPNPKSMSGAISDSTIFPGTVTGTKKKKQRIKNRPKDVRIASSPAPVSESKTPPLGYSARNVPLTPGKPLNTPSKAAYAGPTFHASPAPSALPIPSFFSKSVPALPSGNSLQAMMEGEGSDGTTSSSQNSPSAPADRQIREESPLEIFFKADREEKAKAQRNNSDFSHFGSPGSTAVQIGSPAYLRSPSSPFFNGPTRDSSTPEMFLMDSDGSSAPKKPFGPSFSTPFSERISSIRANTAPSSMTPQHISDDEERKAKTQALKDYLFNPQGHRPATLSPHSEDSPYYSDGGHASPSPITSRSGYLHRTSSGPSTPAPSSRIQHSHRHPTFHFLQESLLATANGSPSPVSRSSNLRQEITAKTPERHDASYFPTSPTPTRLNKADITAISRDYVNTHINGDFAKPSFDISRLSQTNDNARGMENMKDTVNVKSMEDDLRRILKMDVPPNNNGARSASGSGSGSGVSSVPITASIPGYGNVGRSVPSNGKNNGVLGS